MPDPLRSIEDTPLTAMIMFAKQVLALPCFLLLLVLIQSLENSEAIAGPLDDAEQEEFFEAKVRPLLVEHCIDCHGSDEQDGELRLDHRAGFISGGGSGPVVIAGKPADSNLIRAIGYADLSLQMPPDGKLSDEAIAILTKWVESGAYWPEEADSAAKVSPKSPAEQIAEMRESHWAYRPIEARQPPEINEPSSGNSETTTESESQTQPVDRFILAKVQEAGLTPSAPADRRTLIHRAYFTLLGLPPSYEEVQAFIADQSPDAFAKLIDRLLDSPHYGERWARHWMDIARFAETTGYQPGNRETRYPYAFTYRDYLINAFNTDKPFNEFIIEQLAADQLDLPADNKQALAAMGFLTVGRRFMNRQHDIIDDRIDVVTRGFLGMTVTCARCHDHKYDPIPTADYYSLYGVFASSEEPGELPLLGEPTPSTEYDQFLAEQAKQQAVVDKWVEETGHSTAEELRSRVADYLIYIARTLPQYPKEDVKFVGKRGALRRPAVQRWQQYLAKPQESTPPVWHLLHYLATLPADEFPAQSKQLWEKLATDEIGDHPLLKSLNPRIVTALKDNPPQTIVEVAERIGIEFEAVWNEWTQAKEADPSIDKLADETAEAMRQHLLAADAPTTLDQNQSIAHLDQAERNKYNSLVNQVKGIEVTHPGAPSRGMVLVNKSTPHEPVIFRRGQPGNRGDRVPRRFPQVLSHVDGGEPFKHGSGRLELARAIAHPDNPLTARVIVNRVWQHQFGAGLVRTASDFGTRGEAPTHPELLDYLADEFIRDGWSIKRLQKRLMLSATWQQASALRDGALQTDPENRLLWHMPRRRMEFEPLRDRLLFAAGTLDTHIGGRSVMIHQGAKRRGLYAYVDREDIPSLLASFDLPSPDASQAIRAETTVPQQALYLMNSQFVIEQARALSARSAEVQKAHDAAADSAPNATRVRALYRFALAREPNQSELDDALAFVNDQPDGDAAVEDPQQPLDPWVQLAQVLLLCNEFAFVD
ncbi:DUF1553 domain-containing protein [Planctomycetaceae bacterium SH139]